MTPPTVAECWFLDVGQASCNVVLLGERRALVIDCGRRGDIPVRLLRQFVDTIVALVVTHNDSDHDGGVASILAAYPRAIEALYFLIDRPVQSTRLFALAEQEQRAGRLLQPPMRLETDGSSRLLYGDEAKGVELYLLAPQFLENLSALKSGSANATSGVLLLQCGQRRVLFGGDATMVIWRSVLARQPKPLACDVATVPHHGGAIWSSRAPQESATEHAARIEREVAWLYSQAIGAQYAIISTGTSNHSGHPRPEVLRALTRTGAIVLCTQITRQCCDDLEALRPGVRGPAEPSASLPTTARTKKDHSKSVACAGTIIAEIGPDSLVVRRLDEHQAGIERLRHLPSGHPLCR